MTPLIDIIKLKEGDLIQIHFDNVKSNENIFLKYDKHSQEPYLCVSNGNEEAYRSGNPFKTATWAEANVNSCDNLKHPLVNDIFKHIHNPSNTINDKKVIEFVVKNSEELKKFGFQEFSKENTKNKSSFEFFEVEFKFKEDKIKFLGKITHSDNDFDTLNQKLYLSNNNGVHFLVNSKKQTIALDNEDLSLIRIPTSLSNKEISFDEVSK